MILMLLGNYTSRIDNVGGDSSNGNCYGGCSGGGGDDRGGDGATGCGGGTYRNIVTSEPRHSLYERLP